MSRDLSALREEISPFDGDEDEKLIPETRLSHPLMETVEDTNYSPETFSFLLRLRNAALDAKLALRFPTHLSTETNSTFSFIQQEAEISSRLETLNLLLSLNSNSENF